MQGSLWISILSIPLNSVVLLLLLVSQSDGAVRGSTAGSCDRQTGPERGRATINKELAATASDAAVGKEGRNQIPLVFINFFETYLSQLSYYLK